MNESEESNALIPHLTAAVAVLGAETESLSMLCRHLAQRIGLAEIDGLPIDDWLQREKLRRLESALISVENNDPSYAACLQTIIDESRRRINQ